MPRYIRACVDVASEKERVREPWKNLPSICCTQDVSSSKKETQDFFFYSLHDIVNNNSSFNDSIANYFWSWFVISFLLNSRENGNSVWKQ